jgi:hypothetical protein
MVGEDAVDGDEQPVGVEHGKGVQQDVVGREAPGPVQRGGVRRQVAVAEHGALGPARGAAGVQDGGQVARFHWDVVELLRLPGRGLGQGARAGGVSGKHDRCPHGEGGAGVAHEDRGVRVGDHVGHLLVAVGRVHGEEDGAGPEAGQVGQDGERRLLDLDRDPVAGTDAGRPQGVGQLGRSAPGVAVADDLAGRRGEQRHRRVPRTPRRKQCGKRVQGGGCYAPDRRPIARAAELVGV